MKKQNIENKRNRLDIILTDLQPVETPEIYTMEFFYQYLSQNKCLKKIENKEQDADKGITCASWHAAPLKYHTLKDNNEYREMSYLNPVSMIEICLYLEKYEGLLLSRMSRRSFSIRKHRKKADLIFKQAYKGGVEYGEKRVKNKEATGDFYEIFPYARLDLFYKSLDWYDLNRRFKYFGKLDYSKCFDSIYTHTYNWIIADTTIDAKEFNKKHYLSATDRLLQNINMSITNGIVVGPEFSRFLAEIILQAIDEDVISKLVCRGLKREVDYDVKRYVDDIFIFANNEETVKIIIDETTTSARKYRLKINEEKKMIGKLPHSWSPWISKISDFQKYMIDSMFYSLTDTLHKYLIKERSVSSINKMAKIKELFQNVIISDEKMNVKIVSYCLTTLFNKIRTKKNNDITKTIFNIGSDKVIYCFYDLIFFFYSFAPTYKNTDKLICIIHTIENEIGELKSNTNLEKIIKRYDFIFYEGNVSDITNLIFLCALKKIGLGVRAETQLLNKIDKECNPMYYAIILIYDELALYNKMGIKQKVEKIISEKVDILKLNLKQLFLSPDVWWPFVFWGCPYLSTPVQQKMTQLFNNERLELNSDTIWACAKRMVIDFWLDTKYPQKIIRWNVSSDTFYKSIIFKTFERTIFNNDNLDEISLLYDYV